jgi:diacylglycerol O-acyltransferase
MAERLRPQDVAFLSLESRCTPMHVGSLETFDPHTAGFDYDNLVALLADRISHVPRYRQVVRTVPGRIANPVWVDDDDFDLTYHVRRSALPLPGSMEQLRDLVARIMSRRLDRDRPLWEVYLVEGLSEGRFAVLSKTHQALVDGTTTLDLGQLILDDNADAPYLPPDVWSPVTMPTATALAVDAVVDSVLHPGKIVDTWRSGLLDVRETAGRLRGALSSAAFVLGSARPASESPLSAKLSQQRRFVPVATRLDDYRAVRAAHGGTVNDVVMTVVAGALRSWLLTRGEPVHSSTHVLAMVPMSVIDDAAGPTALGSRVQAFFLNLPVGEPNPVVRLHQVSYALKPHRETGRAVGASRLAAVSGFAPTTFHALGARVAASHPGRGHDLVITNVPGPQFPLYAAGARMLESYPIVPLVQDRVLSVGVSSYDGGVFFGLNADRDAMSDVGVLAVCLTEALEELVGTLSGRRASATGRRSAGKRT